MDYTLRTEEETIDLGRRIVECLPRAAAPHACLIALVGDLGAGKTTCAKGVAAALGVETTVQSPTFVLAKFYAIDRPPFKTLVHVDAYRLKDHEELNRIGWKDIVADPATLVLIEWPEHVEPLGIDRFLTVMFAVTQNEGRIARASLPL